MTQRQTGNPLPPLGVMSCLYVCRLHTSELFCSFDLSFLISFSYLPVSLSFSAHSFLIFVLHNKVISRDIAVLD